MHTFSAEHLLASLRLAGVKTRSLTIVGIEPAYTGPVEGLSPQLKMAWSRAIDVCARVVMNYLNSDTA
jgi:Txe/YoeB family toxin of Txe-Axe toxin-antitoxin module